MKKKTKEKLNKLASQFYSSFGYHTDAGYDFSEAHHPQEVNCWNMALLASDELKGTLYLLRYYVDSSEALKRKFSNKD